MVAFISCKAHGSLVSARARLFLCVLVSGCATTQLADVEPFVLPTVVATEPSPFVAVLKVSAGFVLVDPTTGARTPFATTDDGPAEELVMLPNERFVVTSANAAYLGTAASAQPFRRLRDRPPGMSVVASDRAGRTLVWYRADEQRGGEYFLTAPGAAELIPLASVAYPGESSVSEDGRFVSVSGIVQPCVNLAQCRMWIWTWRADSRQVTPQIAPPTGAAYKPQYLSDEFGANWLYYQTTSFDDTPQCAANINVCEHTIVRRRAAGGPETVVAQQAFAFARGSDGVSAHLTHDAPECEDVMCGALRLHLVDASGDRVVADPASSVRPRAFSPDGRWLMYEGASGFVNALRLRTGEIDVLGDGFPLGWLRRSAPSDGSTPP